MEYQLNTEDHFLCLQLHIDSEAEKLNKCSISSEMF